jgi:phage host-nuclease inhibitor protein Gam
MARKTKTLVTNVTREEAESAFAEFAKADAKISKINSDMDLQFVKIREKNQDTLSALEEQRDTAFEKLQVFAEKNPDLFGKRKSIELVHGVIGFRTGTPKLKLRKGFQWGAVLELIKNHSIMSRYIRTTEEVAKDKLLNDREEPEVLAHIGDVGVCFDQDERFYVEPKREEATA